MVGIDSDEVIERIEQLAESKDEYTLKWLERWQNSLLDIPQDDVHNNDPYKPWLFKQGIYQMSSEYIIDHLETRSMLEIISDSEDSKIKEQRLNQMIEESLQAGRSPTDYWEPIHICLGVEPRHRFKPEQYAVQKGLSELRSFYKKGLPLIKTQVTYGFMQPNAIQAAEEILKQHYKDIQEGAGARP